MKEKINKYIFLFLGILGIMLSYFFVGTYVDWSDGDMNLFIKQYPTSKQYFYSPEKYYRLQPKDLTNKELIEERYYQTYIANRYSPQKDSNIFPPIIIYQLTITLIFFGLVRIKNWQTVTDWQTPLVIPVHFIFNIIPLFFLAMFVLISGFSIPLALFMLLLINYVSIKLILKYLF